MFAVGYVRESVHGDTTPIIEQWSVVKHRLSYITGTHTYRCVYKRGDGELTLTGYSNSDMASDCDDRKCTSGAIFFLGHCQCPVSWQSRAEAESGDMALSSCEAEYIAAASAACQGVSWLSRLLAAC